MESDTRFGCLTGVSFESLDLQNAGNSTSETELPNIFTVRKVYYKDHLPQINSYLSHCSISTTIHK